MINRKRKGFTLVELVIVIAIIAILAAVLVPTFASIIRKANESADIQAVRQMNTALAAKSVETKPASIAEVILILKEAGYNAADKLVPVSSKHGFYWCSTANMITLIKDEGVDDKPELIFPVDYETLNTAFEAADDNWSTATAGDAATFFDLEKGMQILEGYSDTELDIINGGILKLEEGGEGHEIKNDLIVPAGKATTITISENATLVISSTITVEGTLVITGGSISATDGGGLVVSSSGMLSINGAKVTASGKNSTAISVSSGGTVTLDDTNVTASGENSVGIDNNGTLNVNCMLGSTLAAEPSFNLTGNDSTLTVLGLSAHGIKNNNGGTANLAKVSVSASDESACGIRNDGGTVHFNGVNVTEDSKTGICNAEGSMKFLGTNTVKGYGINFGGSVSIADGGTLNISVSVVVLAEGIKINGNLTIKDATINGTEALLNSIIAASGDNFKITNCSFEIVDGSTVGLAKDSTNGTTITLTSDTATSFNSLAVNGTAKINLNSKELTLGATAITVNNGGTLSVIGNGTINANATNSFVVSGGTLNLGTDNSEITVKVSAAGDDGVYGNVIINNCNFVYVPAGEDYRISTSGDNVTVTLLRDVTLETSTNITKNVTINLNGRTLKMNNGTSFNVSSGSLEISGSGNVTGTVDQLNAFLSSDNLTLNGCTFNGMTVTETDGGASIAANGADLSGISVPASKVVTVTGTLTLNDLGTISGTLTINSDTINGSATLLNSIIAASADNLTIASCTFVYSEYSTTLKKTADGTTLSDGTVNLDGVSGALTVNNAKIEGTLSTILSNANLTLSNCTYGSTITVGKIASGATIRLNSATTISGLAVNGNVTLELNGQALTLDAKAITVNGGELSVIGGGTINANATNSFVVSGGTLNLGDTAAVEVKVQSANDDGVEVGNSGKLNIGNCTFSVAGANYTLTTNGETVTASLSGDVVLSSEVTVSKNVIILLNGHTLTMGENASFTVSGSLSISNNNNNSSKVTGTVAQLNAFLSSDKLTLNCGWNGTMTVTETDDGAEIELTADTNLSSLSVPADKAVSITGSTLTLSALPTVNEGGSLSIDVDTINGSATLLSSIIAASGNNLTITGCSFKYKVNETPYTSTLAKNADGTTLSDGKVYLSDVTLSGKLTINGNCGVTGTVAQLNAFLSSTTLTLNGCTFNDKMTVNETENGATITLSADADLSALTVPESSEVMIKSNGDTKHTLSGKIGVNASGKLTVEGLTASAELCDVAAGGSVLYKNSAINGGTVAQLNSFLKEATLTLERCTFNGMGVTEGETTTITLSADADLSSLSVPADKAVSITGSELTLSDLPTVNNGGSLSIDVDIINGSEELLESIIEAPAANLTITGCSFKYTVDSNEYTVGLAKDENGTTITLTSNNTETSFSGLEINGTAKIDLNGQALTLGATAITVNNGGTLSVIGGGIINANAENSFVVNSGGKLNLGTDNSKITVNVSKAGDDGIDAEEGATVNKGSNCTFSVASDNYAITTDSDGNITIVLSGDANIGELAIAAGTRADIVSKDDGNYALSGTITNNGTLLTITGLTIADENVIGTLSTILNATNIKLDDCTFSGSTINKNGTNVTLESGTVDLNGVREISGSLEITGATVRGTLNTILNLANLTLSDCNINEMMVGKDANGVTITLSNNTLVLTDITISGAWEITGEGNVTATGYTLANGATLTITGATVTGDLNAFLNSSQLTLNDCTLNGKMTVNETENGASITANGADLSGISVPASKVVTVTGTLTLNNLGTIAGTLTVKNATITNASADPLAYIASMANGRISFTNCTFGGIHATVDTNGITLTGDSTVSSGTVSSDVAINIGSNSISLSSITVNSGAKLTVSGSGAVTMSGFGGEGSVEIIGATISNTNGVAGIISNVIGNRIKYTNCTFGNDLTASIEETTVTLGSAATLSGTVTLNESKTVNITGGTLTVGEVTVNSGTLTLTGNVAVNANSKETGDGTLEISGATISTSDNALAFISSLAGNGIKYTNCTFGNDLTASIDGTTVTLNSGYSLSGAVALSKGITLDLSNNTLTWGSGASVSTNTLTVKNAVISGSLSDIVNNGNLTLNSCTYGTSSISKDANGTTLSGGSIAASSIPTSGKLTITNATISTAAAAPLEYVINNSGISNLTFTNCTFKGTNEKDELVATVSSTGITLTDNSTVSSGTVSKDVTINLGGYTLTATSISNSGNLTVENGALSITGEADSSSYYGILNAEGATLEIATCSLSIIGEYTSVTKYVDEYGGYEETISPSSGIYNLGTIVINSSDAKNVAITATAENAIYNEGEFTISGKTNVKINGTFDSGIYNVGTFTASGEAILAIEGGFDAYGIYNEGTLTLENESTSVNVSGDYLYGVKNYSTATISNLTVSVTGESSCGINNSYSSGEQLTLTKSSIEVDGTSATGYYSDTGQPAYLSKVTITVNGDGSNGIGNYDSTLTITDSEITVTGSNSTAISNNSVFLTSKVTVERTKIAVNGSGSKGVNNSRGNLGNTLTTTINNSEITVSGEGAYAVHNFNGACTVTMEKTNVTVSGSGAYGLHNGQIAATVTTINEGTFKAEGDTVVIHSLIYAQAGKVNVSDAEIIGNAKGYANNAPIALVELNGREPQISLKNVTITSNQNCIYSYGEGCKTTTDNDENFTCRNGCKIFDCGYLHEDGNCDHYEKVPQ